MESQPKTEVKNHEDYRKFLGDELVIATHNQGKLNELKVFFMPYNIDLKSADDLNLPEPEETEDSYIGNAVLKAVAAAKASGKICLADDSGFAVEALNGDPGIYSARWAVQTDGTRDFSKAMIAVNDKLGDTENRNAKFVCAIALAWPDGHVETVEAYAHGTMVWPPRGEHGFGYDPVFQPDGQTRTFGQMEPAEKHSISHRTKAIEKIIKLCFR